jgi:hypothetical protein
MSYILLGLAVYFLYNIIFKFVIPIVRTTRNVKKQFSTMHQQMQDQFGHFTGNTKTTTKEEPITNSTTGTKPVQKEYIDFEDVE